MSEQPWYTEFFGEDYLRVHRPYLTPGRTEQETIGIIGLLGLPAGAAILDLACGHGRHAIPLASVGYRMTGFDLSTPFIDRARLLAHDTGVDIRWVQGDMRALPFGAEFDAVINIFNTFGYLENEFEDRRVLDQVHRVLKPGGVFLLETINRDGLVRNFVPADVDHHDDGLVVTQEQTFDALTGRLNVLVTLFEPGGARRTYRQSVRYYTLPELVSMFGAAGLQLEAYHGALDGSALTMNSLRLVLVARKPGGAGM